MAMDLLEDFPAVARATVLDLARLQGVRDNPRGEEEPGRILHEHRSPDDPHAARLALYWDLPYYGSVDSTPQWINLLVSLCAHDGDSILAAALTDRLGRTRTVRDALADGGGRTGYTQPTPGWPGATMTRVTVPSPVDSLCLEHARRAARTWG